MARATTYVQMGWRLLAVPLQIWVTARVVVVIISALTGVLFYDVPGKNHSLETLWNRWDSQWYIYLATQGYHWAGISTQSDLSFFPLFPLALRAVSTVIHVSPFWGGVIVANGAALLALVALRELVRADFGVDVANRTLWLIGLFPTAFFFVTAYSESLFLLCCVCAILAMRRKRWLLAGGCAALAGLTRQLGVLLIVPLLVEGWQVVRRLPSGQRTGTWRRLVGASGLLALGPLSFMGYQAIRFGNPFLFLQAQHAWDRVTAWPWTGTLAALARLHQSGYNPALQTLDLLDLCFFWAVVALIILGARRLPLSYTLYAAVVWLAVAISPAIQQGFALPLLSSSRFAVTLFPPFITLALYTKHPAIERAVQSLFVALLALFVIIFVRGKWVA